MRSPTLGKIDNLPATFGKKFAIDLFTRGNFSRHFEIKVKEKDGSKVNINCLPKSILIFSKKIYICF